jgi:hypothetical protein
MTALVASGEKKARRSGRNVGHRTQEARSILSASRLLKAGLRPNTVALITRLSAPVVRALYVEAHGTRPRSGPDPDAAGIIRTLGHLLHATGLMAMYTRAAPSWREEVDMDALLSVYPIYEAACESSEETVLISLQCAWHLARHLRSRTAEMQVCQRCCHRYIVVDNMHYRPRCPFCETNH